MVAGEATLIAFAGGLLGCVLATGLSAGIAAAMQSAPGFVSVVRGLGFSPLVAALTLSIALFVGLVSSVVPALHAARISIVDALQFNG